MPVTYSEHSAGPSTRRARAGQEAASDYSDWTKAQLQEEAERLGLAKSGTKVELIARIEEAG